MTAAVKPRVIVIVIAIAALATLPFWISGTYYINVSSQILFYAVFALGLNVLVGYAGLVSLGHAGLFGVTAYATGFMLQSGYGHTAAILVALVVGVVSMAIYAILSLRSTGIGFIMITLALGEVLWGLAYRWISLTGGDNGISVRARPAPFGYSMTTPTHFYYVSLVIFLLSVAAMAVLVRSPFGASLMGTRDQPRRMNALGYHVWMIRFYACLVSGLLTAVSGILFVYYTQFISPQTLALTSSAEVLLMVISGEISPDKGSIHLFGQDVTKVPSRRRPHLGMARTYQIITLFPRDSIVHNVSLALLGLSPLRWNPIIDMKRQGHIVEHARTALERVGLAHIAERACSTIWPCRFM